MPIPPLTEERRKEISRQVDAKVEESKIALRSIRDEARKAIKAAKQAKEIGEDDQKRLEAGIDDSLNKTVAKLTSLAADKQTEIMTV